DPHDGHRHHDVLVGAPLYMAWHPNGQRSELGRLYLYLGGEQRSPPQPHQTLTGTHPYGRFAAAIASLGDLDKDGYDGARRGRAGAPPRVLTSPVSPDVAVGAPLGGEGGSGQVFIYRGQSEGLQPEPTQRLDSPFPGPAAFGFALRGATDLDGNGYSGTALLPGHRRATPGATPTVTDPLLVPADLLVGAYGADGVAVYWGQPVVVARTQLQVPDGLNPETLDCVLPTSGATVSW
ncbi:ITA2B protein, partial [Ramphastos sulfuratus]|nr:ITA2B protein [Ramphastos sulfuratus]